MRHKFKIYYPNNHADPLLTGTKYKPPKDCMVVINTDGMFFLICGVNHYYPNIKRLSQVLPK